jgi:hypothetical protein
MPREIPLSDILQSPYSQRQEIPLSEAIGGIPAATNTGQTWVQEDINTDNVNVTNYMQRAAARIQQYQQARSDIGEDRLTANEQVAIVDAYRQTAGLQPEGYYMTKEGAAVPRDRFAEIRRKRTEDDVWANFTANLSQTVLQNLVSIRGAQARICDTLGITDGAMAEIARESEEVTRILQPSGGKSGFAGQAIGNVMNLFLGAGQAPAMFAMSTAGSTFLDVAQRRAQGQEISAYTEWTSAIANATIEYALESFGQAVARKAGMKLAGRIGDLRSAITHNGIRGGIRAAAAVLVKFGTEQAGMALEGAAEEGITELLQNVVRRLSYADEQKIFGGVGTAALQGAVMPLLAAPGMAAIQHGRAGGATPEARAGLSPIAPSPAAGEQTLADSIRPLQQLMKTEKTIDRAKLEQWIRQQANKYKSEPDYDHQLKRVSQDLQKGNAPKNIIDMAMQLLPPTIDRETGERFDKTDEAWPRTGTLLDFFEGQEQARIPSIEKALYAEETLPENLKRSLPAEADIPDVRVNFEESALNLTDKWIGDRQLAEYKAGVEAKSHQDDLKSLLRDGEQLDQVNDAIAVYINMRENSDSYTVENIQRLTPEQQAVIERAQSLSPDQQVLADQIIAENKAFGIEAMEAGIIRNFKENYSALLWKKGDFPSQKKARFTISTPRARQRTLPSLIEGWAKGMELEVPGAIEAQMLTRQQIAQVIHDRNLITLGFKSKVFTPARTDKNTHQVKHPNFAKWVWTGEVGTEVEVKKPAETVEEKVREVLVGEEVKYVKPAKVYGKDIFMDSDGNMYKRSDMYTDKKTAKYLNNALGSSELFNIKGVGEILKYNQVLKHAVLTISGFHYFAFTRSYMLASRGLNPVKGYREGCDLVLGKKPGIDQLVQGGLTLGDQIGLDIAAEREATRVGKLVDKVPMASWIRRSLINLSRANSSFLFNKYGTYLKANAAYLDYQHQLKKHANQLRNGEITEHDIAKRVATVYNADFGGLNLQRIGRNPTLQALHRAVSLAPDWTESNVRTMVGAFKRGDEGSIYRGMWGRVLMKGVGATILANFGTAVLDDEEDFLSQYKKAWNKGNLRYLDVDVTSVYRTFGGKSAGRKYLSVIGHFRDPIKFVITPPRSAKGKMSMLARMGWEMGSGQDWRGRTFTSFGELAKSGQATRYKPFKSGPIGWEQAPSYIIKQSSPQTKKTPATC